VVGNLPSQSSLLGLIMRIVGFTVVSLTDSEIKGDVLYLGHYQSSFNWDDETAKVTGVWGWIGDRLSGR
jgi:hypothetical protein